MEQNRLNPTVFHGTNLYFAKLIKKYGVMLKAQRELTDFGKGFYVTTNKKQAIEWAQVKSKNSQMNPDFLKQLSIKDHPAKKIPVLITFNLDFNRLIKLNGVIFPYRKIYPAFFGNLKAFCKIAGTV